MEDMNKRKRSRPMAVKGGVTANRDRILKNGGKLSKSKSKGC